MTSPVREPGDHQFATVDHQFAATSSPPATTSWPPVQVAVDDEDDRFQPARRITAEPEAPPVHLPGEEVPDPDDGRIGPWPTGLRFVRESPGSLLDQIDYARDGAYSIHPDSVWRKANIVYATCIAFLGLGLCYLIGWAFFTRLSRALMAIPVTLLLLWLLNQIPITQWLIPDAFDFTTWVSSGPPQAGE